MSASESIQLNLMVSCVAILVLLSTDHMAGHMVGKCTSYWYQIFSGFNTPKIIKIG